MGRDSTRTTVVYLDVPRDPPPRKVPIGGVANYKTDHNPMYRTRDLCRDGRNDPVCFLEKSLFPVTDVSIHAPARGATEPWPSSVSGSRFQSTPPRGGRRMEARRLRWLARFQSTPPAWGATLRSSVPWQIGRRFQSTPPAWGATCRTSGADQRSVVSIHAPARGATSDGKANSASLIVSIHAPAWGATHPPPAMCSRRTRFNPRPRAGGDRRCCAIERSCERVSIHAPARGATVTASSQHRQCHGFNPRPRAGGDRTPDAYAS